jgi:hypothetical protein
VPGIIPVRPILAGVPQNIFYLGLGHAVTVDMRLAGIGIEVVPDIHVGTPNPNPAEGVNLLHDPRRFA